MSGCSCHINPPCSYCLNTYECVRCLKLRNKDDDGMHVDHNGDLICNDCLDALSDKSPVAAMGEKCICPLQTLMSSGCKCGGK